MRNWETSNEFQRVKKILKPTDKVSMPEMATGAFVIERDGFKYKVRYLNDKYAKTALEVHKELLKRGWLLPHVYDTVTEGNESFSFVEWIDGKTFWELYAEKKLTEQDFYEFGKWLGKLNCEKIDGKYVSCLNYFHKNIFKDDIGNISYLDLNKLYLTDFPQAFIDKYIITEDIVTFPQREAFLKGYREFKEYDIKKVIKWHCDTIYSQYHDIYLDQKLFFKGKRRSKERIDMMNLPKKMKDYFVVDFGCSGGMFSLECMLRGAQYVYGNDTDHRNIENRHHRLSDMTKLIAYYHGYDGRDLHFKHIEMDTDWYVNDHISNMKGTKKIDIAFCLGLTIKKKDDMLRMLGKKADVIYFESDKNEKKEVVLPYLKKLTELPIVIWIGTDYDKEGNKYELFRCSRKATELKHVVTRKIFDKLFGTRPITGIEIGVMGGAWTNYILTYFPKITKFYAIDPWKHFEDGYYERAMPQDKHDINYSTYLNKIRPYKDKVVTMRMGSEEAIEQLKNEKVDFIFIDGCHEKEFVEQDIKNYYPLVKKGGFLGGHDYGLARGVTETIDKYFPNANKEDDFVWWIQK